MISGFGKLPGCMKQNTRPLGSNSFLVMAAFLACARALPAAQAPAPAPVTASASETKPIRATKIVLVGDSTTAVHSGWGGSFCAHHVTSFAACVNLARGGRSTLSYRAEGSWKLALAEARTPGFVDTWILIQFGHNDQPGKPGRSTDLEKEFPGNLRRYVAEARSAHSHPVLLTPLTRRQFKDGQLQNDLAPWAAAVVKVAAEEKVPVVDLNALSVRAVEEMGPTKANGLAQVAPSAEVAAAAATGTTIPAPKEAAALSTKANEVEEKPALEPLGRAHIEFDYTHLGRDGAEYFSKMVTDELAVQVPAMRPYLVP
jgi:lysophospholipase L1-like esterase